MKPVALSALENAIIKPGFEKQLIPLLAFKGRADLGRMHRAWNFTVAAMLQECQTTADMVRRMDGNPAYSHLLSHDTWRLESFWSRLLDTPAVAAEHPGMLDYIRSLDFWRLRLTPVSPVATRSRHAWWRTFESKMPAWRALQAERKAARLAARKKEREARAAERAVAREERRALLLKQREDMRAERAATRERRRIERERAAREPKKFVLRDVAEPLAYPFLIHDGGRPEHDLLRAINAAVPKGIMGDLRADICQDLAVGVLCGDFSRDDLLLPAKEMIRRIRHMFPEKYGPLSLDALVPGTNDLRLIDTI